MREDGGERLATNSKRARGQGQLASRVARSTRQGENVPSSEDVKRES